jgi:hypothetical protein
MAIQAVNMYAFNVKRLSQMIAAGLNTGPNANAGVGSNSGIAAYEGDQVYVASPTLAGALATLAAQYSTDLGPVSGGAIKTPGAITQMTGS